jgi:molecular chaperone GrpE
LNEDNRQAEEAEALDNIEHEAAADNTAPVVEGEIVNGGDGDTGEAPSLEERLAAAEARAAEYLDGWQRERAEFANARKRLEKNRMEARQFATIDVISRLLPVLDDFQRALETVPEAVANDDWFNGIVLVHRKLLGLLDSERIERIAAVGEPFDPNVHEAVMQEPAEDHESGVVIRELQTGYRLGDRVIRPAMVVVAE